MGYGYDDVEKGDFLMAYPGVRIPIDVKLYLMPTSPVRIRLSHRLNSLAYFLGKYSSSRLQSPSLNCNEASESNKGKKMIVP